MRTKGKTLGKDNIIVLNGKRYDALTGKLLGKSSAVIAEPLTPSAVAPRRRNIDGVVAAKRSAVQAAPEQKIPTPPPSRARRNRSSSGTTLKPHQPEKAKTLMRRVVHKPKTNIKPAIRPQIPSEVMAKPVSTIVPKASVQHIDPVRLHRARQTPRHGHVARFHRGSPPPRPILQAAHPARPAIAQHAVTPIPHYSAPAKPKAGQASKQLFENAIAQARSHEQPAPPVPKRRKKHGRIVGTLAGLAAFLILGGFLAYLNMPKIELKVASIHAGFDARLPSYSPTGYKLVDIKNNHGTVSLSFRSGESRYHIRQQASNWNSQTLRDDLIASADHRTVESKGRIIYLYDNHASWMDGGVRYDITLENAHLSQNDVVDIATSM